MELEEQPGLSDLTQLEDITLEKVLACLIHRFEGKEYCTFAGSVLVSINPCCGPLKAFGTEDDGEGPEEDGELSRFVQILKNLTNKGLRLEPHVLSFGVKCLFNLSKTRNNQVIVVSGDSGAGKTTCTQELIKFFTYSEGSCSVEGKSVSYSLERKIFEATLILEALGNASTVANPNSSRFGRLVRLYFSKDCKIQGAEIKTYLLEKHRVSKGSCNERNFHVFHYLLQAVQHGYLDGHSSDAFGTTYWQDSARITDLEKFISLSTALTILDLFDEFLYVFEVLLAILHLRNVEFVEDNEDDEDKENLAFRQKQYSVSEKSQHHLEAASIILGVSETSLHNSLIFQTFSAGNRRSVSMSPCVRKEDCEARLHSLISTIYEKLFHHVVNHINKMLGHHSSSDDSFSSGSSPPNVFLNLSGVESSCISILDLYGFENLETNHLEQLCINYANERIQQVQVSVLKGYFEEERRLKEACVEAEEPQELLRLENEVQARLNILQQDVFCILDEACLLKRPTPDKAIFHQLVEKLKENDFVKPGKLHSDECPFVIRHYAADVKYSMTGMITKNKDFIPDEFISLLGKSSKPFVQNLVQHSHQIKPSRAQMKRKPEGRKTILMRFKTSVNDLVKELCETFDRDLHFIKCIRPNTSLRPGLIDSNVVKKQLYACGIVDIIRIAGNGYPIRMSKRKFLNLFPQLVQYFCGVSDISRLQLIFTSSSRSMKIGKHNVFLTEKCLDALQRTELLLKNNAATAIQSYWRSHKERIEAVKLAMTATPEKLDDTELSVYFTPMAETFRQNPSFSTNSSIQPESSSPNNHIGSLLDFSANMTCENELHEMNNSRSFVESFTLDANNSGTFNNTLMPSNQRLYYHNRIVSRTPVHSLPIKVYTKKTALGFIQRPPRLRANGIHDALEEYGIVLEPCNDTISS